jgi:hypothetical protein
MKNDLIKMGKRYDQLRSDLLHGGHTGNLMKEHIANTIIDELLEELIYDKKNIKKALMNMFELGDISK